MKKYEAPELAVVELDGVDVIQTSGNTSGGGDNETPWNPAQTSLE